MIEDENYHGWKSEEKRLREMEFGLMEIGPG
jgi:hypothetical protein